MKIKWRFFVPVDRICWSYLKIYTFICNKNVTGVPVFSTHSVEEFVTSLTLLYFSDRHKAHKKNG